MNTNREVVKLTYSNTTTTNSQFPENHKNHLDYTGCRSPQRSTGARRAVRSRSPLPATANRSGIWLATGFFIGPLARCPGSIPLHSTKSQTRSAAEPLRMGELQRDRQWRQLSAANRGDGSWVQKFPGAFGQRPGAGIGEGTPCRHAALARHFGAGSGRQRGPGSGPGGDERDARPAAARRKTGGSSGADRSAGRTALARCYFSRSKQGFSGARRNTAFICSLIL